MDLLRIEPLEIEPQTLCSIYHLGESWARAKFWGNTSGKSARYNLRQHFFNALDFAWPGINGRTLYDSDSINIHRKSSPYTSCACYVDGASPANTRRAFVGHLSQSLTLWGSFIEDLCRQRRGWRDGNPVRRRIARTQRVARG